MALVCVTHVSNGYNIQRSASVHNGRSRRAVRWTYTSPSPLPPLPQPHSTHKFHQAVTLRNYIRKFSARNSAGKLNLLFLVLFSLSNQIQRHLVSQISPRLPSSSFTSIHNSVFLASSSSSSVGATTLGGFWPALRFRSTIFYLYTSLSSFSLSSSLNPLLLGQAISVLVFLLFVMNMVSSRNGNK